MTCGEILSAIADVSTIIACVVTAIAVILSAWQFRATQKASRESQAVDLFVKFNQLNIEQSISSSDQSDHWYNNSKFVLTESLYEIAYRSESWEETVKWMLRQQEVFIHSGDFAVETYSKRFRDFCKAHGYALTL